MMKIKPRLKQLTKYTDEEKQRLFGDRLIVVPTATKNKKKYSRKLKHKGEW